MTLLVLVVLILVLEDLERELTKTDREDNDGN